MNIDILMEKLNIRIKEIDEIIIVEPDKRIKEYLIIEKNILKKIIYDEY